MRFISVLLLFATLALGQEKSANTLEREQFLLPRAVSTVFDVILAEDLETPQQFRGALYIDIAAWNAWCNYHPTAVDIFGRSRFKRPACEHTIENKNIATVVAVFRIYEASPQSFGGDSRIPAFREFIEELGYDPDDRSTDMTTAIGIGNRAGFDTARLMVMDGWNSQGDLTSSQENYVQPFADYTGYVPKNNPWRIRFPFRWQPLLENNGRGFFFRQESVTPFAGSAIAFSQTKQEMKDRKVRLPFARPNAPIQKALKRDVRLLKSLAMDVLNTSAHLTEEQRIYAELFDNKIKAFKVGESQVLGISTALRFALLNPNLDHNIDEDMIYVLGSGIAAFDSMVAAWKEKRRLDAVRPTGQTMKFLFGDSKVKVWGGPGKGAVEIDAGEWQPYIRTMPHAEFPSGSACTCSTLVEHALINTNFTDSMPLELTIPKGSSRFYPGQVPENDFVVKIDRLSDWSKLCGQSRLWAGVHFRPSVEAGENLCRGIGKASQDLVDKLVAGESDAKWLSWLPENIERFWEED
ncbi:PAP2/haloperoxidase-like protein [Gracilaria domingensis]|nr:PAP2/haloperoxidase-like protein [Gracilaria domingensis]